MDTMTLTKISGAFCGALLVFLLGGWAAEELYHIGGKGHGDDHHQAYSIEIEGDDDGGEEVAEEGPDFEVLMASADAGAGEKVFRKCASCHKVEDGGKGTGPHLYGVVGREIAVIDGFKYSGSLKPVAEAWTPENLNGFLEDPKGWAPGTAMNFKGLAKPEDRANLIAYLDTIGG
ncbi:cytochrome c family protein [Actibacterium sp. 188UL27-1]|uniref:c-type cytochrome n=1 Tax=Actibacterium sp. 188UL27-1 TaxID=2786961 RepID=UPI00195CB578|nr:cytochrome c family protein [Actibacterium sp. 188UL27-1]MBM7069490.1 cytochrome c family protein [Actibacterium sp. 188UL27-1]